jgi:hypothetical protein
MTDPDERAGLSRGARWAIALGGVVVLVVAFVLLGNRGDSGTATSVSGGSAAQPSPSTTQQNAAQPEPPPPAVVTIRVKNGQPVGGVEKIELRKGDRIRFRVIADTADEVHLHGYDVERELVQGKPTKFDLPAGIEGRFEVELHHSGAQIARIDVNPA